MHIGLGAFHRAHQAWYTARAGDGADWGIAAFSGRSTAAADALIPQDGVFTLVERGADGDRLAPIGSIVEAQPSSNALRRATLLAAPRTAVVTLTVTEAGYTLRPDGSLDTAAPAVTADLARVRRTAVDGDHAAEATQTVVGMLAAGLIERHRAGAGSIAIVPCDNFPSNGPLLRDAVTEFITAIDPHLNQWLVDHVSFVSTSVDRITPKVDDGLTREVERALGWTDAAPVATEPFADWTLSGEFPAGRPQWERSGAAFVEDIDAYESRKLWMLNGAHSLLAYLGRLRGHTTVAAAMGDPFVRYSIEAWWDEAARHLPAGMDVDAYRRALTARFENQRIEHLLAQISTDGLTKLSVRIAPVAVLERRAGRGAQASALVFAAWITALRSGLPMADARRAEVDAALADSDPTLALLAAVSADLAADPGFSAEVVSDVCALASVRTP
ncbi:mannitol dehydrogenase family protein [Agromyces sp. LHK192]|uniref:mannitol dehydrogenase family protein n=1 Tax=Agromyces sp. LHK192 TaxID=2498704 RepID=UPI00196A92BB|nr:mannitol dehydrogenase family protein [Agromyces sp. LHK192]